MRVPSRATSKEEQVVRFRVANGRLGEETTELDGAINIGGHRSLFCFCELRCFSLELNLARSLGCVPRPRSGSLIQVATYENAAPLRRTALCSSDSEGIPTRLAVDPAAPIRSPKATAISNFFRRRRPIGYRSRAFLSLFKASY